MWGKGKKGEDVPSFLSRVAGRLEFPVDVGEGLPQLQLMGNREAIVEGCQRVLEYHDGLVRLYTGRLRIKFVGRGLRMEYLTGNTVKITGRMTSVEFQQG